MSHHWPSRWVSICYFSVNKDVKEDIIIATSSCAVHMYMYTLVLHYMYK